MSLNSTTDLKNSVSTNTTTLEQLQKDITSLKSTMDEMKSSFSDQLQDLIHELDEEKKARAALQIEVERLQKFFQKSPRIN